MGSSNKAILEVDRCKVKDNEVVSPAMRAKYRESYDKSSRSRPLNRAGKPRLINTNCEPCCFTESAIYNFRQRIKHKSGNVMKRYTLGCKNRYTRQEQTKNNDRTDKENDIGPQAGYDKMRSLPATSAIQLLKPRSLVVSSWTLRRRMSEAMDVD